MFENGQGVENILSKLISGSLLPRSMETLMQIRTGLSQKRKWPLPKFPNHRNG